MGLGPKGIGPNKLGAPKAMAKQTGIRDISKAMVADKLKHIGKEIINSEPRPTYKKELKRLPIKPIEVPASAGVVSTGNTTPTSNADISSIKTKNNTSVDKKELRKVKRGLIKEQRQKFKEAKKEIKSYTDY